MRTSLHGIARAAQEDRCKRFRGLYSCFNRILLEQAFRNLNKNAAAGVDGVTYRAYEADLQRNLVNLEQRLKSKRYHAKLVRRSFIPKANGGQRPLGVPALEDKIVQNLARSILECLFEPLFLDSSYAYRPGRSARDGAQALRRGVSGKVPWVVEADIKSFFDTINHDQLIEMVRKRVDDEAFIRLLRKWLRAGVLNPDGTKDSPSAGTPQGSLVSPVLANIYLHYALDTWYEQQVKKQCRGDTVFIRYADDFVCAFQYHREACTFLWRLRRRLAHYGLSLAEEKTRKLRFNRFRKSESESFEFLGFEYRWIVGRSGRDAVWMRTAPARLRRIVQAFKQWLRSHLSKRTPWILGMVKTKLRGLRNYFGVRGNSKAVKLMHARFYQTCYRYFNRRSQRRSFTWPQFARLWNRYNISSLQYLSNTGEQLTFAPYLR